MTDLLWPSAWAVVPLVLLVAAICRLAPCQPVTRHVLWVVALASFLAPLPARFVPLPSLLPTSGQIPLEKSPAFTVANETVPAKPATADSPGTARYMTTLVAPDEARPSRETAVARHGRVDEERKLTAVHGNPVATQAQPASGLPEPAKRAQPSRPLPSPWTAALVNLHDALTGLPTPPAGFWCAGAAAVVAIYVVVTIRFRRRFRRAHRASRAIERQVAAIAGKLGLRRVPETLMLREPISPLVWCGRRPRLVLPVALWSQLDQIGRRAILCHELAHLRRRDHWVRWLELLISTLFWWHPLAWWVRRRVREEADLCCDAWVTWLMPTRRRAYAEALLVAREHADAGSRTAPAVAMGATSSGTKRFARRITMIMTRSSRPGISRTGIALAGVLAAVGLIVVPAWSMPPKDKCDAKVHAAVVKCKPETACAGTSGTACCPKCGAALGKACDEQRVLLDKPNLVGRADAPAKGYSVFVSDGDQPKGRRIVRRVPAGDDDLERKLAELEAKIQALTEGLNGLVHARTPGAPRASASAPPPPPARTWVPRVRVESHEDAGAPTIITETEVIHDVHEGEVVARTYALPGGKLKALTELMIRSDVPVAVRPLEDGIEVHARPAQHKIFKAFIEMIDPDSKAQTRASEEQEDVLTILGDHAHGKAIETYARAIDASRPGPAAKLHKLHALGQATQLPAETLAPLLELEVLGDGDDLIEILDDDDLIEIKELQRELEESSDRDEDTGVGRSAELRRTIREFQRQAKKLQALARELERQAEENEE